MNSLKQQIRSLNSQRKQATAKAETIVDILEREMCLPPSDGPRVAAASNRGRKASRISEKKKAFMQEITLAINEIVSEITDESKASELPENKSLHYIASQSQMSEFEDPLRRSSYGLYRILLDICKIPSWMDRDTEMKKYDIVLRPTQVAWVLQVQRDSSKAWDFFSWAARRPGYAHDEYCYSLMIGILGRSSDHACLDALLSEMDKQKIPHSVINLNRLIEVYACRGDVEKAERFFIQLIALKAQPNSYIIKCMMDLFAKAGKCEKALGLFEILVDREDTIGTKSYRKLLDSLSQSGQVNDALRIYGIMKESGTRVGVITYGFLLRALGCAGMLSEALEFLAEMVQFGMKPSRESYNGILAALAKQDDVEMGIKFFKRMSEEGVHPDFISCQAVSKLLCNAGQARRALELACFVESDSAKVEVYGNFVKILGREGYIQEAFLLVKALKAEDIATPEAVFVSLVEVLCSEGAGAKEIMAAIKDMESSCGNVSAESYNSILEFLCKKNQFIVAFDVLKKCYRKGNVVDAEISNAILAGLSKEGSFHLLEGVWEQLAVIGSSIKVTTFNALLDSSSQVGDIETTKRLLHIMEALSVFPNVDTYNAAISCFIRAGRFNVALQVFNEMNSTGCRPNTSSYNSVLVVLRKVGLTNAVVSFFKRMKADGIMPDASTFAILSDLGKEIALVNR